MAKSKFGVEAFTATQFATAEEKCNAANAIVAFIDSGFVREKFTKRVYDALCLHLFGHIAHYNLHGFYAEWFASPELQQQWLTHVKNWNLDRSNATFTWCDVERAVKNWVIQNVPVLAKLGVRRDGRWETMTPGTKVFALSRREYAQAFREFLALRQEIPVDTDLDHIFVEHLPGGENAQVPWRVTVRDKPPKLGG